MFESIDHVNLVVRDLVKMKHFYENVLCLTVTKEVAISGPWVEDVVGLQNVKANVIYLEPAVGPRVELIEYVSPPGNRPDGLAVSNTLGIRHLAFRVRDIELVGPAVPPQPQPEAHPRMHDLLIATVLCESSGTASKCREHKERQ